MVQPETSAVGTLHWLLIHIDHLQTMETCDGKAWEMAFLRSPKKILFNILQACQVLVANYQLNNFHSCWQFWDSITIKTHDIKTDICSADLSHKLIDYSFKQNGSFK